MNQTLNSLRSRFHASRVTWIIFALVLILLLSFFLWLTLSEDDDGTLADIRRRGTLRVGLDASFPPFEMLSENNQVVGLDADIARAIGADLGVNVDEKSFYQYCFNHKCNLILEDSFIQIESIKNIAHNIDSIYLKLNSIPEQVSDKYFSILKRLGINFHFLVKNKSILEDVKFKYFDQNVDYLDSYKQMPNSVSLKDRFFSFKFVVEGDSVYSCLHHWKNNIDNNDNIVDNADYWEELDYFYIYEQERT